MLREREIKTIANKLGWNYKLTRDSIKDLFKKKDKQDWNFIDNRDVCEFFKACLTTNNRDERRRAIYQLFRFNFEYDYVKMLTYFLRDFFFILVWELFDENEYARNRQLNLLKPNKSDLSERVNPFIDGFKGLDEKIDLDEMTQKQNVIFEGLVGKYVYEKKFNIGEIILKVAREVGFKVFQIEDFREHIFNFSGARIERELISALIHHQKQRTQKEHWYIFRLVEKLRNEGFGTRQSFRIVGEYMQQPASSIHRRYYEKSKEAKKRKLKLDDIISMNEIGKKHLSRFVEFVKSRHSPVNR